MSPSLSGREGNSPGPRRDREGCKSQQLNREPGVKIRKNRHRFLSAIGRRQRQNSRGKVKEDGPVLLVSLRSFLEI